MFLHKKILLFNTFTLLLSAALFGNNHPQPEDCIVAGNLEVHGKTLMKETAFIGSKHNHANLIVHGNTQTYMVEADGLSTQERSVGLDSHHGPIKHIEMESDSGAICIKLSKCSSIWGQQHGPNHREDNDLEREDNDLEPVPWLPIPFSDLSIVASFVASSTSNEFILYNCGTKPVLYNLGAKIDPQLLFDIIQSSINHELYPINLTEAPIFGMFQSDFDTIPEFNIVVTDTSVTTTDTSITTTDTSATTMTTKSDKTVRQQFQPMIAFAKFDLSNNELRIALPVAADTWILDLLTNQYDCSKKHHLESNPMPTLFEIKGLIESATPTENFILEDIQHHHE